MKDETQKISAAMIFEILGKPPEHLTETLNFIIDSIGKEPGISVKKREIREPKELRDKIGLAEASGSQFKVDEKNDLYLSFADIEIEADKISTLSAVVFKYMPAHIEIISPMNLQLANSDVNDIMNEIVGRLHQYDEVARVLQIEKAVLETKLKSLLEGGEKEPEQNHEKKGKEAKPKKAKKK